MNVKKGLEDVIADRTEISLIDTDKGQILVRGYRLQDLARICSYEQVAYLLLEGELVGQKKAQAHWQSYPIYSLPPEGVREKVASGADPCSALRTIISWHGLNDRQKDYSSLIEIRRRSWALITHLPIWIASLIRPDLPIEFIEETIRNSESSSAGFLSATLGRSPSPTEVRVFDCLRNTYSEHGFNAATFTARVAASTVNDFEGAVTAACAALRGMIHGGAVELIVPMLEEALNLDVEAYVERELTAKRKIVGFGHRIYRQTDSRFPLVLECLKLMSEQRSNFNYYDTVLEIKDLLSQRKDLHPNLDLAGAPSFRLLGFESKHMVNLIILGRAAGWCAHILEQNINNRIIRPDAEYIGPSERPVFKDQDHIAWS